MTEHHTAQVNGTRLHYVTAGEGPTVVLLHGWPETSHEWRHVTELLAGDHQVVVPDLRGFGASAKPARGWLKSKPMASGRSCGSRSIRRWKTLSTATLNAPSAARPTPCRHRRPSRSSNRSRQKPPR